jgi:hypothetical protein
MDDDTLGVRIRLLPDPPLWSWEIVDDRTQRVVRSSWNDDWVAYETREAAAHAARALLGVATRRPPARVDERPARLRRPA